MNFLSKSEIGLRQNNEDNSLILDSDKHLLAIVCDGMGGHESGEIASNLVIKSFEKIFNFSKPRFDDYEIRSWFNKGIQNAIKEMEKFSENDKTKLDMGTTFVGILYFKEEKKVVFANIGDSRGYAYNGLLHQITKDQNLLNYYIEEKKIKYEEAIEFWDNSHLLSSVGPTKKYSIDYFLVNVDSELKNIVLTSDGIHDFLEKAAFETILFSDASLEAKATRMIQSALRLGSNDNLTVVILEF